MGLATPSSTAAASNSKTFSYSASGSEKTGVYGRLARPSRYAFVTSSNSMIPFLAPASIAMLVIVSRASMSMWRRVSPVCAVDTDLADHVKDQVLRLDPLLQPVVIDELERFWDAEPQLAQRENACEVGRADARGEVVQRAVGARVRVGSDDELARQD